MNNVTLIGRVTKDVEVRYTADQKAVARFTVAVNRDKEHTDFIPCIAFNKTAENMQTYVKKGDLVGVDGMLSSGTYEKDGTKVYTTDVIANRVEFLEPKQKESKPEPVPTGYAAIEEDIPF